MVFVFSGNYPLCRVLPNIYEVSPESFQGHVMALVSLLPHCDNQEKLALIHLFGFIAKDNPSVSIKLLWEFITNFIFIHYYMKEFL